IQPVRTHRLRESQSSCPSNLKPSNLLHVCVSTTGTHEQGRRVFRTRSDSFIRSISGVNSGKSLVGGLQNSLHRSTSRTADPSTPFGQNGQTSLRMTTIVVSSYAANFREKALKLCSAVEVFRDGRIHAGHASRIRKDQAQFTVLRQRSGGEVFRAEEEFCSGCAVVCQYYLGVNVVALIRRIDCDLRTGALERVQRCRVLVPNIFLHKRDRDASFERCHQCRLEGRLGELFLRDKQRLCRAVD